MKPWEKYQEMEVTREPKETGPWDKYAEPEKNKGLIDTALAGLEKYGSAPLRAAYGQAQDSLLKKGIPLDVVGAAKAAYDQFGEDPEKAPTAAQLVEQNPIGNQLNKPWFKEQFAKNPTALGLRGLLAPVTGWDRSGELVGEVPRVAAETLVAGETDPLSYVPGAVFEKPAAKAFELGGKALANTGKFGAYLAENTTGIPRDVWSNYAKRSKEIAKMAKDYVGDNRYMQAYTDFRNQVGDAIAGRKNQLNEMIDQGLGGASRASKISVEPIISELDNAMRGLHPVTEKAAISEIEGLKNIVKELAPEGKMSAWDTYKLQRLFHNRSMKAFAEGGQIFNPSSQAAKAAKSARYKTTEIVNKLFPDTIKRANSEFVSLHNIDDMIPPSMLDSNGSAAALRRAALDPNSKERKALSQLSQFLHGDDRLVQQAMDLSTFEKMTNLPINPLSGGGTTSTSRTLLGGGVGLLGEASDDPEAKWLARGAGAMIASPALLKMGLDAGLMVPRAANKVGGAGGLLEKGVEKLNPTMRALEKRLQSAGGKAKEFIKDEEGKFSPEDLLNILKPGEENVFDLKTARGMAGEPKRGLLEPKDNPAGAFPEIRFDDSQKSKMGPVKLIDPKVSQSDRVVLSDLSEKVKRGEKLTDKDRQFLKTFQDKADSTDLWQQANEVHLKDRFQQQEIENMPYFRREVETRGNLLPSDHARLKTLLSVVKDNNPKLAEEIRTLLSADVKKSFNQPDKPKGLLTSLDVERGPVTELPEAGAAIPFNDDARIKLDRQRSSAQSGQFKPGQLIADEDGRNFKILDVNPKTGMIMLETPDGGRSFEYADTLAEYLNDVKNAPALMSETKGAIDAATAAEAERMKKGLIGVDFGGRGGKPPKPKTALDRYAELKERSDGVSARVNKRMAEQEKNFKPAPNTEDVFKFFESKGAKPKPIYEKNGVKIYTKDSNSFGDQIIHYSVGDGPRKTETFSEGSHMDLDTFTDIYGPKKKPKGGKGKKELVDALMSGEMKVPGISIKRGKENPNQGLIGVDFGGRGGKMPKEKAPTFPKDAKFQKNQEVTYEGRPAKVVQYDGNGVYTVKVGNSHQQVHMSELNIRKGKPKKKK